MSLNSTKPDEPLEWNAKETVSIIIFCIVFLLLSYYSVLKRICCANSSGNQVQRRLLEESNQDDPSLQFERHGLELSVIQSLRMSLFKKSEGEEKPNRADCAICLGEFEEGEWLKHLPNCTHAFHVSCIDFWLQSRSNCPLCRTHVHLHLNSNLQSSGSSNSPAPEALNGLTIR
ncbi:putative RING-H2 finger protein ATL53 [Neltuma alba]|uniref:putative RING-H2 finger protein ATL53 n=1 Tax=Neltuma alba TaxID=207710 RepID=UPI0010A4E13F|nr:putative RING-H2 finger protein ATL53 [Prosopis alba]